MKCPRCHAENREGRRFCGECGFSLASTYSPCGFLNVCGGRGDLKSSMELLTDRDPEAAREMITALRVV